MSTPAKRKAPTFSESSAQAGIKRTKPSSFPKPRNASASTSTLTSARASPAPVGGRLGASSATGNPDQDVQLFHQGIKDATGKIREYASENDRCPVCKTDRYSKPTLRVLVSPCYHKMCETCIDQLYTLGPQGCPQCGRILRKTNYIHQTFEDLNVEKEVGIRKRLNAIFNKERRDFKDDKAYNDYLEMVEDITFNLIEGIDVQATEARILTWQRDNSNVIQANAERQREEHERQRIDEAEQTRLRKQKIHDAKYEDADLLNQIEAAKREIFEDIADGGDGNAAYAKLDRLKAALSSTQQQPGPGGIPRKSARTNKSAASTNPLSLHYAGPYVPLPYNDPRKSKGFQLLYLPYDKIVTLTGGAIVEDLRDEETKQRVRQIHSLRRAPDDLGLAINRIAAGGYYLEERRRRELFQAQDGLFLGLGL